MAGLRVMVTPSSISTCVEEAALGRRPHNVVNKEISSSHDVLFPRVI